MTGTTAMTDQTTVRAFVNGRGVHVPAGGTALDAVRLADPAEADAVAAGQRAIADSRGLPLDATVAVHAGAIYRTVSARAAARPAGEDDA